MARKLPSIEANILPLASDLVSLGKVVRNARAHGGLRIDDAASLSGVSSDFLSRLENGKPVTTDRLLKVLEALGLQILVVPKDMSRLLSKVVLDASLNESDKESPE